MAVLVVCFFVERFENKNFSLDDKNDIEIFLEFLLKGLRNFKFLPHRFERLGILNGILYINDSKATNINSSIHAITSARKLYPDQEIILICGGDSKGQNFAEFANICGESIKRIYLIGKDSYKLYKILNSKVSCVEVSNLADALAQAKNFAESRNIILLSPACSSKDMFIDYIDRGQQFKELLGII
jgi:UDP-N-acetylmuramoylalanine--D-glutamate ligase